MRILVIGCGSIGKRHARNAAKFAHTGIVDSNLSLAETCAQELNLDYFPDLESGLAWRPDGVIIATPTHLHIPLASQVVNHVKHVMIEKPISNSIDNAHMLLERSKACDCSINVVCNMRFHPGVRTLHKNLNRIGKTLFARAHYGNFLPNMRPDLDYRKLYCASRKQGGGVLLDCIHEIDYLHWFFGSIEKQGAFIDKLSNLEIDVEDYACLCLKHTQGPVSEIHMDYLRPFKRRGCEIVGDQGMLFWQSEGKNPEQCSVRLYLERIKSWETLYRDDDLDVNMPYQLMIKEFIDAIKGNETLLLSGRDAVYELKVLQAAADEGLPGDNPAS